MFIKPSLVAASAKTNGKTFCNSYDFFPHENPLHCGSIQ
jgi:hypothetical protein